MGNDREQKMMDCLDAFEAVNDQLTAALRQWVELMSGIEPLFRGRRILIGSAPMVWDPEARKQKNNQDR